MKKYCLFSLLTIVAASFFMSCASLPKTLKPGDTLIIGYAEIKAHDFTLYSGTNLNGTFHSDVELEISEQVSGRKVTVKPNREGYFYVKGLKAGYSYAITKVSYMAERDGGGGVKMTVNVAYPKYFVAIDNKVVNLGCTYYDFDGSKNWVTWVTRNHHQVKVFFESLQDESEWYEKDIVEYTL